MNHLPSDRFVELVLDRLQPTSAEAAHLAHCPTCRAQLADFTALAAELNVAAAGEPTPAVLARYYAQFDAAAQRAGWMRTIVEQVKAVLVWDGRGQAALSGARSAAAQTYRLLYQCAPAEIEMMVSSGGHTLRLDGEIIPADGTLATPALLELAAVGTDDEWVTESDEEGRFVFADLTPGAYRLTITTPIGTPLLIEPLEIA